MLSMEPSRLSDSKYATRSKELLSLVQDLRAIGAHADLDLPSIAVIGNQSAGNPALLKLSLRSLFPEMPISIRWEFDKRGKRKNEVKEEPFGIIITDKGQVELALRRAQAAVLHPDILASNFLKLTSEELKSRLDTKAESLQFSRNTICVSLEGPGLPDLSFIDLPGIIHNTEPHIVALLEDIVVSHIKGNCLILVALPITDDIDNLTAPRLARQVDPEGRRTIGVVTKPDIFDTGSTETRELWLDVIEGRRHPLKLGYYCTRQPNREERTQGITTEEARAMGAEFFHKDPLWSSPIDQGRFGTNNLVRKLSTLLIQLIDDTLPKIRLETSKRLDAGKRSLAQMAKPIGAEPAMHMLGLVTEYCNSIQYLVRGGADAGRLVQENLKAFSDFKVAIRNTASNFVPFATAIGQDIRRFHNYLEGEEEFEVPGAECFSLTDMREHIKKSVTRELPDNIPFESKVVLINGFQATWMNSFESCLSCVHQSTLSILLDGITKDFQTYRVLQSFLRPLVPELLTLLEAKCYEHVCALLESERTPFTQNTHDLSSCKDKWIAKYKDARASSKAALPNPIKEEPAALTTFQSLFPPVQPKETANNSSVNVVHSPRQQAQRPGSTSGSTSTLNAFGVAPPSARSPSSTAFASSAPTTANAFGQRLFSFSSAPNAESFEKDATINGRQDRTPSVAPRQPFSAITGPGFSLPPLNTAPLASSSSMPDPEKAKAALAASAAIGYTGLNEENLGILNPPDEYETELVVMAEVRSYFQVSYKRVIDVVPALIDLLFVQAVAKELQPFLFSKLGLGTENANKNCERYLAEDPDAAALREELMAKKKRLESVQDELNKFGQ